MPAFDRLLPGLLVHVREVLACPSLPPALLLATLAALLFTLALGLIDPPH